MPLRDSGIGGLRGGPGEGKSPICRGSAIKNTSFQGAKKKGIRPMAVGMESAKPLPAGERSQQRPWEAEEVKAQSVR